MHLGDIGIIVGTGPSLTDKVIMDCGNSGLPLFGANNAWKVLDLDVFHACNWEYYHHYWEKGLKETPSIKYTIWEDVAKRYNVNFLKGEWKGGLSRNKGVIYYHHGTGPQLINIAYHHGIKRMLLVGWDMAYRGKVNDRHYTQPRHYFGDDELSGKHFPKTGENGEFTGLIKEMETIIPEDYGIEIINCTPNSAMTCFPMMDFDSALKN